MVLKSKHVSDVVNKLGLWALGFSIVIIIFERPIRKTLVEPSIKYISARTNLTFDVLLYIFLFFGFSLVGIVYWLFWSERKLKSKITRYFSRLVCPDYYKDTNRLKVAAVMGDAMLRYRSNELQPEEDFKHDGTSQADRDAVIGSGAERQESFYQGDMEVKRIYFGNGKIKQEAFYREGKLEGPLRNYYEDGRLHQEKKYINGRLNGLFRSFDEDGALFFEIEYKDDKQHGKDRIFAKGGILQFEDTYVEGRKINRKTYDANGQLKYSQDF
jgi:hypothetical protein